MRRHRLPELTDTQLTVDHVPTAVHNALYCLARGRKPGWPKTRKPLFCRGMRVGATTCGMVEYPRQESNNQRIPRDVCKFQRQPVRNPVQLTAKTPQSTPIWTACSTPGTRYLRTPARRSWPSSRPLRGGNRQIRTTPPPLARGGTPVIVWAWRGIRVADHSTS